MPRTARIAPKEYVYHILTRGNNRQDIFKDEEDYNAYIKILLRYKQRYKFHLYHYVLMNNHVHLVIEPSEEGGSLAEIMKGINLSYAQYYKGKYKHIGHFWQDRYKSIIVSKDEYLLACGSYVELNPVRARIVKDPRDYRWSSYNTYAYGKRSPVVDEHPIYQDLSKDEKAREERYREFVKGMVRERESMKGDMEKRIVYGGDDFLRRLKTEYVVEVIIKPKGRPKKQEKR